MAITRQVTVLNSSLSTESIRVTGASFSSIEFSTPTTFPIDILAGDSAVIDVNYDETTYVGNFSEVLTVSVSGLTTVNDYSFTKPLNVINSAVIVDAVLPKSGIRIVNVDEYAAQAGKTVNQYMIDEFNKVVPSPFDDNVDSYVFQHYDTAGTSIYEPFATAVDLTGINWQSPNAGTLVTQQHAIYAQHFTASVGATVTYIGSDGVAYTRTVVGVRNIVQVGLADIDISLVKFDSPLPAVCRVYPILHRNATTDAGLPATPIIDVVQGQRVWVSGVRSIETNLDIGGDVTATAITRWQYSNYTWHAPISGDSGSPEIVMVNGESVLMSTLFTSSGTYAVSPYAGDDTALSGIDDLWEWLEANT